MITCESTGRHIPDLPFDLEAVLPLIREVVHEKQLLLAPELRKAKRDPLICECALRKLKMELAGYGFTGSDHGLFRATFFYGSEWVIKFPIHPSFAPASYNEFDVLKRIPENKQQHFAEMYNLGEGVVLQKFYKTDQRKYLEYERSIAIFQAQHALHDLHYDNVGWEGNKFVVFDFTEQKVFKNMMDYRDGVARNMI